MLFIFKISCILDSGKTKHHSFNITLKIVPTKENLWHKARIFMICVDSALDQEHFSSSPYSTAVVHSHFRQTKIQLRACGNCVSHTPAVHYVTNEIRLAAAARKLMRLQRQIFIHRRMHVNGSGTMKFLCSAWSNILPVGRVLIVYPTSEAALMLSCCFCIQAANVYPRSARRSKNERETGSARPD